MAWLVVTKAATCAGSQRSLNDRGVRVFRMDMRGCGAGEELARGTTHCGRWADAAAAVEFVARLAPASPTALVGFSLGGTIALNMAGELGAAACGNLVGVLAVCSPIDLHSVKQKFDTRGGRPYDRFFVGLLWQKVVAADARAGRISDGRLVAPDRGGCGSSTRSSPRRWLALRRSMITTRGPAQDHG